MILAILKELGPEAGRGINRSQIYEEMVNRLLSREVSLHAIKSYPIAEGMFKNVFTKLSYILMDKGYAGYFPWGIVGSLLSDLRISWGDLVRLTHLGIVSEVMEGSPRPGNELSFRHQSFQEYLASLELKRQILVQGEVNRELLIMHLEYNRWDEVLFFLIGSLEQREAKAIISFIYRYDLSLAGRCIAYYKGNKDKDFKEIIDRLFEDICFSFAPEILAKIATEGILTRIYNLLKSKDEDVRRAAADALGMIGSERAFEYLIPLLKDIDKNVRRAAADALGKIGSERGVEYLIPLLKDKNVRWVAADALGKCSKKLKEDELFRLVQKLNKEGYDGNVEDIKRVHQRRFLKVLYPGLSG
jgi:hypothetical protein